MVALNKVGIRVAPLSNRIVLARFGKDAHVALEKRDAMNEFLQALVQYAFDGQMPEHGQSAHLTFGGGDEQFECVVTRGKAAQRDEATVTELLDAVERRWPGSFWHFAKGRLSATEPLYGFQVLFGSDEILAEGEGESAELAIRAALDAAKAAEPEAGR